MSRVVRKATKTNRARTITLSPRLRSPLPSIKPENIELEQPVFKSSKGNSIDDHTRHTLISHALDRGMNPIKVAQLTSHDAQTLYENYAANVNSRPRLPEIIL